MEAYAIDELVDPRLGNNYTEQEVYCMLHAASLCIRRDPQERPRMSQARILFMVSKFRANEGKKEKMEAVCLPLIMEPT